MIELYHDLAWQAFETADVQLKQGHYVAAAELHEAALAFALLGAHPMRTRVLLHLDEKYLVRNMEGRLSHIIIDAHETKNFVSIIFDLTAPLSGRIDRHLKVFRPTLLGDATSTALFPSENTFGPYVNVLRLFLCRIVILSEAGDLS
jgi:hypothetical protein